MQAYFKTLGAYISPPICTNRLIFISFFLALPSYPIISKLSFCDVITSLSFLELFHYLEMQNMPAFF